MKETVSKELIQLCAQIINERKTLEEWALIESDDLFQSGHYSGGFDADEMAFCFSHSNGSNKEIWFQLTIEEVKMVKDGKILHISAQLAG